MENNRIKEKLMNARTLCPGFSNDMYALTDQVACAAENNTKPFDLISILVLLESLLYDSKQYNILDQVELFPQIVDMITDENYSQEFRVYFRKIFGKEPQSMKKIENTISEYPEYVVAAVNWWASAVSSTNNSFPGVNNPVLEVMMKGINKKDNAKDMSAFKETLAREIMDAMSHCDVCHLDVDYSPCDILSKAGDKVKLSQFSYPFKTFMTIRMDKVVVMQNYQQTVLYSGYEEIANEDKVQARTLKPKND